MSHVNYSELMGDISNGNDKAADQALDKLIHMIQTKDDHTKDALQALKGAVTAVRSDRDSWKKRADAKH